VAREEGEKTKIWVYNDIMMMIIIIISENDFILAQIWHN